MITGKLHRSLIILMLVCHQSLGLAACSAQRKGNRPPIIKNVRTQTPEPAKETKGSAQVKTLKEGAYASVKDAFIAVARDQTTYQLLRSTIKEIPEVETNFFEKQALIAVFLGSRRSGGYGVEIQVDGTNLRVSETSPSRDMMTTQALTSAFKIVAVPVNQQPLLITTDQAWSAASRPYKLSVGDFSSSGGIAGRTAKYNLNGQIQVLRHKQLATFIFHLKGEKQKGLEDLATGAVQDDGRIIIEGLSAEGLLDQPHGSLTASGQFAESEAKLTLKIKTSASKIPDGFNGEGSIEAVATAPPPTKAKSRMSEDDPM